MNPTNQQLQVAIALHLGAKPRMKLDKVGSAPPRYILTFVPFGNPAPYDYGCAELEQPHDLGDGSPLITHIASDIPNYPVSLDACAKFENFFPQPSDFYRFTLEELCGKELYHLASPYNRCIAFVKTHNLVLP